MELQKVSSSRKFEKFRHFRRRNWNRFPKNKMKGRDGGTDLQVWEWKYDNLGSITPTILEIFVVPVNCRQA